MRAEGREGASESGFGGAVEELLDHFLGEFVVFVSEEVLGVFELAVGDRPVDFVGVFAVLAEGQVAAHELVEHDACSSTGTDGPEVDLQAVAFAFEDLGRHVVRRAEHREGFVDAVFGFEDFGRVHVDEIGVAVVVDHDVLGLDVSVDDVEFVEVLDGEEHAADVELRLFVAQQVYLADGVEEIDATDVGEQEVDEVFVFVRAVHLRDEGEVDHLQHVFLLLRDGRLPA